MALEEAFKWLNWRDKGISIYGKRLNYLRFADDLIVIAENPKNWHMFEELKSSCSKS